VDVFLEVHTSNLSNLGDLMQNCTPNLREVLRWIYAEARSGLVFINRASSSRCRPLSLCCTVEGLIASKPRRRRRSQIWKASPSAHESWTVVGRTVAPLAQRLQTAVARWRCTSQTVENKTATTESRSRLDLTVVGVVTKDFPWKFRCRIENFPFAY
jgi:hypothetical protein